MLSPPRGAGLYGRAPGTGTAYPYSFSYGQQQQQQQPRYHPLEASPRPGTAPTQYGSASGRPHYSHYAAPGAWCPSCTPGPLPAPHWACRTRVGNGGRVGGGRSGGSFGRQSTTVTHMGGCGSHTVQYTQQCKHAHVHRHTLTWPCPQPILQVLQASWHLPPPSPISPFAPGTCLPATHGPLRPSPAPCLPANAAGAPNVFIMTTPGGGNTPADAAGGGNQGAAAVAAAAAALQDAAGGGAGAGGSQGAAVDAALMSSIAALRHRQQQYMDAARLSLTSSAGRG